MADESKTLDTVPAEPAKVSTTAPAMHTGAMWDGPQWITQATEKPVWVETQAEFWALMNRTGFRVLDQQESDTGPKQAPAPTPVPLEYTVVVVPAMTQDEAHIFGAVTAVWQRYGLIETLWCEACFARGRSHGCRMRVNSREIHLECRCGTARYVPPVGTTDLVLNALANSTVRERETVAGTVLTAEGERSQETIVLNDMEAMILQRYVLALQAREKEPRIFHRECFNGDPRVESEAISIQVHANQIVMVCPCRTLFWRARKPGLIH